MEKMRSREHFERRVDRYYLLAAATRVPEIRQLYIDRARYYRQVLSFLRQQAMAVLPYGPLPMRFA